MTEEDYNRKMEIADIADSRFKANYSHTEPSTKTLEKFGTLEDTLKDISDKLEKHKLADDAWRKKDAEWKASAVPVIEMGKNLQGFGKVVLYVVVFVSAVGGAIFTVVELGKKWLNK